MQQSYLICCTSRTGSTALCRYLHNAGLGQPDAYEPTIDSIASHTVNGVFAASTSLNDYEQWLSLLEQPKHIFLRRCDLNYQAVSLYRAIETGVWGRVPGDPDTPAPEFDMSKILEIRTIIQADEQRWLKILSNYLPVWYEVLDANPADTIRVIAAYLGRPVTDFNLDIGTIKQRDSITEEWVKCLREESY